VYFTKSFVVLPLLLQHLLYDISFIHFNPYVVLYNYFGSGDILYIILTIFNRLLHVILFHKIIRDLGIIYTERDGIPDKFGIKKELGSKSNRKFSFLGHYYHHIIDHDLHDGHRLAFPPLSFPSASNFKPPDPPEYICFALANFESLSCQNLRSVLRLKRPPWTMGKIRRSALNC